MSEYQPGEPLNTQEQKAFAEIAEHPDSQDLALAGDEAGDNLAVTEVTDDTQRLLKYASEFQLGPKVDKLAEREQRAEAGDVAFAGLRMSVLARRHQKAARQLKAVNRVLEESQGLGSLAMDRRDRDDRRTIKLANRAVKRANRELNRTVRRGLRSYGEDRKTIKMHRPNTPKIEV